VEGLKDLKPRIIDRRLEEWPREQPPEGGLIADARSDDHRNRLEEELLKIQEECGAFWECTSQYLEMVRRLAAIITEPNSKEKISVLKSELMSLLSNVVRATFVVEKEPPHALKMNTHFTTSVRFLIGNEVDVYNHPPQVKVFIINEDEPGSENFPSGEEARVLWQHIDPAWRSNGSKKFQLATGKLVVSFEKVSLTEIEWTRGSPVGRRFSLLFMAIIRVGNFHFSARARSLPFVSKA